MQRITLKRLPLENLKRKPLRTIALIVVAACLSAAHQSRVGSWKAVGVVGRHWIAASQWDTALHWG